jgi:flagella basal body P-ring formation protein FlgA
MQRIIPMQRFIAVFVVWTISAALALADEPVVQVCFKEKVNVHSRVVLLADVADIETDDAALAQRLASTELVAAPSMGQVRSLRQRELIDHVQLNGFNLQSIEFSGASITQVSSGVGKGTRSAAPTTAKLSAAQRRIKQAVSSYLRSTYPQTRRSTVEVACDESVCTAATASASSISVVAAEEDSATSFKVVIAIASRGNVEEFTVTATTSESTRVVVAARALRSGAILTAADLKLATPKSENELASAVTSIEDLVGRELTRGLAAEQAVPFDQVVVPRLVRKGDLVEVTAKAGGVRVTTQAIAQQDGALGESIALEPVDTKAKPGQKNKDTIRAQVIAAGQAQIAIAGRSTPSPRLGAKPTRIGTATGPVTRR